MLLISIDDNGKTSNKPKANMIYFVDFNDLSTDNGKDYYLSTNNQKIYWKIHIEDKVKEDWHLTTSKLK